MASLSLKVIDKDNNILHKNSAENFVDIVCKREYSEGDCIIISSSEYPIFLNIQVDEVLGDSLVYLTDELCYQIPFGVGRLNRSPKAFQGNCHYMYLEKATEKQTKLYRNLALNPNDQHMEVPCYPHASANTETRGEAVFAAQNAIDGIRANSFHGEWPYASWGINRQSDAEIKIDFGREVTVDKLVMYIRADFPHDSWWTQVTIHFSDDSSINWKLKKTHQGQELLFAPKKIKWIRMYSLIKADDPSPFPALTQLEVYGN